MRTFLLVILSCVFISRPTPAFQGVATWAKGKPVNGLPEWIKTLGGTSSSESGYAIAVDGSGNVYVAGGYYNTSTNANSVTDFAGNVLNGKTSTANSYVFVAKFDASGIQQWIKTLGGTGGALGLSIALDSSGNIYVAGYYYNTSANANSVTDFDGNVLNGKTTTASNDVFVAKLDTSGAQQWIKVLGGTSNDRGNSVGVDGSGNVYVTGFYTNTSTNTNSVTDFDGNVLNGKTAAASEDAFVAKLNASGTQQWIKTLGGVNSDDTNSIAVDGSGNVYVAGGYYNTSTNANSVTDFAGNTLNGKTSTAGKDIFVAKLDASGTQQWIKTMGGKNHDYGYSLAVDAGGNVYVAGNYKNNSANASSVTDFAGNALNGKTSTTVDYALVAKLDPSGVQQWIKTLGGTDDAHGYSVTLDAGGNVYVAGNYTNTSANDEFEMIATAQRMISHIEVVRFA